MLKRNEPKNKVENNKKRYSRHGEEEVSPFSTVLWLSVGKAKTGKKYNDLHERGGKGGKNLEKQHTNNNNN